MAQPIDFIDRDVFMDLLARIPRQVGGGTYGDGTGDANTIYGDMSRLVVTWLAHMTVDEIKAQYNLHGPGGSVNAWPLREAARQWLRDHPHKGWAVPV